MWVVARHHRQAGGVEHRLDARGAILMALALPARGLQMPDRGGRGGADRRRQRGGEDEAGRIGAHRVDQVVAAPRCSRRGSRTPWPACPRSRRRAAWRRRARRCRRRADRTCRPRAPRRHRSWRRSARRDRRSRAPAPRRRPWNRGSRTRSASAASDRRPSAVLRDGRDRCAARSASRSRTGARPRSSNCG